jgi:hypothetical protein
MLEIHSIVIFKMLNSIFNVFSHLAEPQKLAWVNCMQKRRAEIVRGHSNIIHPYDLCLMSQKDAEIFVPVSVPLCSSSSVR